MVDNKKTAPAKTDDVHTKCKGLLKSKDCTTDWYVLFTQKNPEMRDLN
jgi:hypothetical protein